MNTLTLVVGVALAIALIARQLSAHRLNEGFPLLSTVFGLLGAAAVGFGVLSVVKTHPIPAGSYALLAVTFGLAVVFGWARAKTVTVWRTTDGVAMRKGTVWTTVLWILSITVHITLGFWIDALDGGGLLGDATLYLYVALTLGVQLLCLRVVLRRVQTEAGLRARVGRKPFHYLANRTNL